MFECMHLGNEIRRMRSLARLSKRELAIKVGVSESTIKNWENEVSKPTFAGLCEICWHCNVDMEKFVGAIVKRKRPDSIIDIKSIRISGND